MWRRLVRGGLLGLAIVLAAFLVYLLATRVESVPSRQSVQTGALGRSETGINQFKFTQSNAGAVQWEVQAKHAQVFETEHRAVLQEVQVMLYKTNGWELNLRGDEGTVDLTKKDFMLVNRTEPIAVQLESGYTIETNHLVWTDEAREIQTRDPVTIVGHGMVVKGRGLIGKLETEEFQIGKDVHVEIVQ